jgi:UDPglucose 6-dehydrogenase
MKIGIIGLGIVGNACKFGFELNGHTVVVHDIKLNTQISCILPTEICFICVPTPSLSNGQCDTRIVESVFHELLASNYQGEIVIKSTVEPGTCDRLAGNNGIAVSMVPEFLRERCAITDFTENHDLCVIGTKSAEAEFLIKKAHGNLPKKFVTLTPTEAEFVKYFNNVYNATLITFANCFHDVCREHGVSYTNIKNAVINRNHISKHYLECNQNFRGFGGVCLPKDLRAMNYLARGTDITFFQDILNQNSKFKMTVLEGMRPE